MPSRKESAFFPARHSRIMKCLYCGKRIRNKRSDAVFCRAACRVAYNRNKAVTDNDNSTKTILSLCDYSGAWSEPYRKAGYDVRQIDIGLNNQDVRLLQWPGNVYGVLAAPPCTMFAISGNRWKRTDAELQEALSIVDACLRIVSVSSPVFWALENPVGTLKRYLGEPAFRFQPCDYGDPYTKLTCLWGHFNSPKPSQRVSPVSVKPGHHRIDAFIKANGFRLGKERQRLRSVTPSGFAQAFFDANR